jgi:hypothetical protein
MTEKKLTVWLKECKIDKYGTIEAINEPYILALSLHNGIKGEVLGDNEHISGIFPEGLEDKSGYLVTAISPIYHRMRRGEYLPLMGKGFKLFGPTVLDGPVQVHLAIMESDSDLRNLGEFIAKARKDSGLDDLLKGVVSLSNLSQGKISLIMNDFNMAFSIVIKALKDNKDDIIRTYEYGEDFYQTESNYEETIILPSNRYVKGSILVEWE